MKPTTKILAVALCAGAMLTGCKQDPVAPVVVDSGKNNNPPPATSATVSGRVTLQVGANGVITGARVAVYAGLREWENDIVTKFAAVDANGNYTVTPLAQGTYYLDVWKDNDNDRRWGSRGDLIGWYGSGSYPNAINLTPFSAVVGNNTIDVQAFIVP
jgi:hypothetical protein